MESLNPLNLYTTKNMESNYEEEILNIGKSIFNEDDISLLKKALTLYVKDLSYVLIDTDKNKISRTKSALSPEGTIAGFILVCKKYTKIYHKFMDKVQNCYEIAFLGIDPSHQGKGLGSQCLKKALSSIYKISRQFNAWLVVNEDNVGAIKLYKKLGFIQWKHIPHDKYPCFIMGISYRRYICYFQNNF